MQSAYKFAAFVALIYLFFLNDSDCLKKILGQDCQNNAAHKIVRPLLVHWF